MTTTTPHRTQERRRWSAEAHRRGWRHSTTGYKCPAEIVGMPCWHRPELGYRAGCLCDALHALGALDHARRWSEKSGRPVVTAEPYDLDDERLAEIRGLCAEHGIDVAVGEASPYHPGRTTLLVFRGGTGR